MTQFPSPQQNVNWKAIGWALFSQAIWLPPIIIDAHDSLISKTRDYDFTNVAQIPNQHLQNFVAQKNLLATQTPSIHSRILDGIPSSGLVLSTKSLTDKHISSNSEQRTNNPATFLFSNTVRSLSNLSGVQNSIINVDSRLINKTERHVAPLSFGKGQTIINGLYSKSDLLGGTLTLADINEPAMPPFAKSEQALYTRSKDPLAPIPRSWRESMRKALTGLIGNTESALPSSSEAPKASSLDKLEQARVVHVLSSKVKHLEEVPLALQSDGTVDILSKPGDPAVIQEIADWTSKQKPPSSGRIQPAVVHLHPIPPVKQPASGVENTQQTMAPASQDASLSKNKMTNPTEEKPSFSKPEPSPSPVTSSLRNDPPPSSAVELGVVHLERSEQPTSNKITSNPISTGESTAITEVHP